MYRYGPCSWTLSDMRGERARTRHVEEWSANRSRIAQLSAATMVRTLTEAEYDLASGRTDTQLEELALRRAWDRIDAQATYLLFYGFPRSIASRALLNHWLFARVGFASGNLAIYDREVYACEASEECLKWFSRCHNLPYAHEAPAFYSFDCHSSDAIKAVTYFTFIAGWSTELCTEDQCFKFLLDHDDRICIRSTTKELSDEALRCIVSLGGVLCENETH